MSCHAMHPIHDLFLESVSFALHFDMHFFMHSYVENKFILVKMGVTNLPPLEESRPEIQEAHGNSLG
jgi:hypothetical protein